MSSILPVEAIRPKTAIDSGTLKDAIARDNLWLAEKKADFLQVGCPACGGGGYSQQFEKNGHILRRCSDCETLYLTLRPDADTLTEYYACSARMAYFSTFIFPASREKRVEHIYKPRLERLLTACTKVGCLGGIYVEVGAGSGLFALLVQKTRVFDQVIAVEPSATLAADCRACGLEVFESSVEQASGILQANVIASFEVLEHLFSPADFMKHIHRILAPNGLCILTTPNGMGLDVIELGVASTTVSFSHMNLFNPNSISHLLQKSGFNVLEVSTPGKLDVSLLRDAWDAGVPPSSPFLYYILREANQGISEAFQQFLCDNLLSSHMWVVAQKK